MRHGLVVLVGGSPTGAGEPPALPHSRRNIIAAEIEKVIDALASQSFDRAEFLKKLDRFYLAIEHAAATFAGSSPNRDGECLPIRGENNLTLSRMESPWKPDLVN